MSAHAIQTRDLTKSFRGGIVAVTGLDLAVEYGSVFGLIGRNGAGKTTTLRLLMGLLRPDQGSAQILGRDLAKTSRVDRSRVTYVSQSLQLPSGMTLEELCRYTSHFYPTWDQDRVKDLAKRWELPMRQLVGRYSGGQQRKAAILLALAPRPEVILLDEPAAGLDPIARRELINELVAELARGDGCTVLFSTHIITDLERIAEHVGIMDRGRLLLNSRLDELQASSRRIQVIFPGDEAPETFCIPGAMRQETAGPVVTAITRVIDPQFLDSLRRRPGVRVNLFPIGLEELFVELFNSPEESIPAFESGDDFDSAQTNFESGRNT